MRSVGAEALGLAAATSASDLSAPWSDKIARNAPTGANLAQGAW
jgi:hypothetical protein